MKRLALSTLGLLVILELVVFLPNRVRAEAECSWEGLWDTQRDGYPFIISLRVQRNTPNRGGLIASGKFGPDADLLGAEGLRNYGDPIVGTLHGLGGVIGYLGDFSFALNTNCDGFTGTWKSYLGRNGAWNGIRITPNQRTLMVIEAYRRTLCRDPDTAGREYWTASGVDRPSLEAVIRATDEWAGIQPTRSVYLNVLGRDPVPGDCQSMFTWRSTGMSRADLEAAFAASREGQRVRAVRDLYIELLGRDPLGPDNAGLRRWVDSGQSLEFIRQRIIESPEYQERNSP